MPSNDETPTAGESQGGRSDTSLKRGEALGRYRVVERIGAGTMGIVYEAYDPSLDRKVALKLLHPDLGGPDASEQLRREAKSLARLDHPNVVAVHDVGDHEGRIFVAMELVQGQTLREWIEADRPSWREVLDAYLRAGRGLAAAHAAKLVHRDFKPANVLIKSDGGVLVTDFGLARGARTHSAPIDGSPTPVVEAARTGAVGTPAYMAPELHVGKRGDARIDQFAFCVALYEGLYGQHPFGGETLEALVLAVADGELRATPRDSPVPPWLSRVVVRGLATDPARRWPSMDMLISALEHEPRAGRRRIVVAAASAVTVTALVTTWSYARTEGLVCSGGESKLAGVWDDGRRPVVHRAMLATRLPFAEDTWRRVTPVLNEYTSSWLAAHADACEAADERMLDRRMACLDARLHALAGLVDVLADADAKAVEQAIRAAQGLPRIESCADHRFLAATVPLPNDVLAANALDERAAAIKSMIDVGRLAQGLTAARRLLDDAEVLGYGPLVARAHNLIALANMELGRYQDAHRHSERCYFAATAADQPTLATVAATRIVQLKARRFIDHADVYAWVDHAQAALERAGRPPAPAAGLANTIGIALAKDGRIDDSIEFIRNAVRIYERDYARGRANLANAISNLGNTYMRKGRYAEALAYHERALVIQERAHGATHPSVADADNNLAASLINRKQYEPAVWHLMRSLRSREQVLGQHHADVGQSLMNIGVVAIRRGDYDRALVFLRRALPTIERSAGRNHPRAAAVLLNLGDVTRRLGRPHEALSYYHRSIEARMTTAHLNHPIVSVVLRETGAAYHEAGGHAEALAYNQRALAVAERSAGTDSPQYAFALATLADIHLSRGRASLAISLVEQALEIRRSFEVLEPDASMARFTLARALSLEGRAAEGVENARAALASLRADGGDFSREIGWIEAWLVEAEPRASG